MSDEGFLRRWSRRKRGDPQPPGRARPEPPRPGAGPQVVPAAVVGAVAPPRPTTEPVIKPTTEPTTKSATEPATELPDRSAGHSGAPVDRSGRAPARPAAAAAAPLPDVESLTPESDFRPFLREGVDASRRNAALRKLFADPHFNTMDGLDVYIDDYSKPDPIPPGVLRRLVQSDSLGLFRERGDAGRPREPVAVPGGEDGAGATASPAGAGPGDRGVRPVAEPGEGPGAGARADGAAGQPDAERTRVAAPATPDGTPPGSPAPGTPGGSAAASGTSEAPLPADPR